MSELVALLAAGLAVGAQYALIALGFVVVYASTGVINLAHGGLVLIGAYTAYTAAGTWDLPFALAIVVAMAGGALAGVAVEVLVLRHMVGQPVFSLILITFGLFIVMQELVTAIWGPTNLALGAPWSSDPVADAVRIGEVVVPYEDIAAMGLAGVVLSGFFALFRFTRIGVAMRATAVDPQAALAQGISARRVNALSWAIAGAVAAVAGVTAADGPAASLEPSLGAVALLAFPVVILGGLDSPGGAVVAGLAVGVTQTLTQGWETGVLDPSWLPPYPTWIGRGFHDVLPYVLMVFVLLVRPYGLFGTRDVRRA